MIYLGICIIIVGLGLVFQSTLYSPIYGHSINFTGYNIPFGSVCILFGILFIWSEIRKKIRKTKEKK